MNRYETDPRSREELLQEIAELAASYVPEWQFDTERPDIGSVLALLFADQLQENLKRYNLMLEQDYVELINMLGISLKPAAPAHSLVQFSLVGDTIPGVQLGGQTKLLANTEDDEQIVFETAHGIYVTRAKLTAAFLTQKGCGSIRPLIGSFPLCRYVDDGTEEERIQGFGYPFTLFDVGGSRYGLFGLLLYHPYLFDVENNDILMETDGGEALFEALADGSLELCYYAEGGFVPVDEWSRKSASCLAFRKSLPCQKVTQEQQEYSILLLRSTKPVTTELMVNDLRFASCGSAQPADFVWNGNQELAPERFLPFGETLGLYDEIYIGHASYFAKSGAKITMAFTVRFDEHLVTIPRAAEDATLKIIKRKPRKDYNGAVAQVYAEETTFEYFDGTGWRRLVCDTPTSGLFNTDQPMQVTLTFTCPHDWQPSGGQSEQVRCIRMQLIKSDNCYYQPANHHYPVISDLTVSYSYEERYEQPRRLYSLCGSDRQDVTARLANGQAVPVLRAQPYQDDALYLCFDQKMEDGPVSLMFQIGEDTVERQERLTVWYSSRSGWERLRLLDYTEHLCHTGTILFMPPPGFARRTLEHQNGYWLKIQTESLGDSAQAGRRPVVFGIAMNTVEADNVETLPMDDYYIDAATPDMDFALNAHNILSVEVWVNETELHSDQVRRALLRQYPAVTYAQYNLLGEMDQFYVRWREVDHFDQSQAGDRHYIVDRMNNRLHFGDGVHVQIPRTTDGVAFRVRIRCCDGERANLAPGQIRETSQNLMFVDEIKNPIRAFGGRNMETMDSALRRGTALLNSRGRLIGAADYERAVLGYSSNIVQVKTVVGQRKDGANDPAMISLVVLMKDFRDGSFSFIHMREQLENYLRASCELSVAPEQLAIVEPIFVRISVEAWVDVLQTDDSFEVQNHLIGALNAYLDPLTNERWEIGQMVSRSQIELRLNMEKKQALVRRMMVTASYTDALGTHETDLEQMKGNPFVIVTGGMHKIHLNEQYL